MAAPAPGPSGSRTRWPEMATWSVPHAIMMIMNQRTDITGSYLIFGDDPEPPAGEGGAVRLLVNCYLDKTLKVNIVASPPAPPPRIG
jgi:hypothetical protein